MASVHTVVGSVASVVVVIKKKTLDDGKSSDLRLLASLEVTLFFIAFKRVFLLCDGSSAIVSCTSIDGLKIF